MGVSVQVVDAQACLDPDLFAEEFADRLIGPLVVSAIQRGEGDHRTLTLSAMKGERLLWSGEMSFVSGECAGIATKAADKVVAGLAGCPECFPTERAVVREVSLPLVASLGAGAPWDGRLGLGASFLVDPGPCCLVAGLSAEVNTPIAVGTEGRAEIVEANARIGWTSVAERPRDPRGWRPSVAGGLGGGAAVVWGGNLAVNRVALAPVAHVWVGVGVAPWRRAQVTFGLRANLVRLDLVAAGNDGAGGDPHVAESWIRAELAFCPVLVGDDRAEQ